MTVLMNDATTKLKRGDTYYIDATATQPNGAAYPVADVLLIFSIKQSMSDADSAAKLVKDNASIGGITIVDAGAGKITIKLLANDTKNLLGMYLWDLQSVEDLGDVHTLAEGKLEFSADITRRVV